MTRGESFDDVAHSQRRLHIKPVIRAEYHASNLPIGGVRQTTECQLAAMVASNAVPFGMATAVIGLKPGLSAAYPPLPSGKR